MRYVVRPISDRTAFAGKHRPSPFGAGWTSTLHLLEHELRQVRGTNVVLEVDTTERDIRIDGQLRANARPATPAVRLAFDSKHGPLTYATDVFTSWQDNVRAIALSLEALRRIDRYGVTKRGEQYTGFKAIGGGSATPMPASHMTADDAWAIIGSFGDAPIEQQRAAGPDAARAAHRKARAFAHPDRHDGDQSLWDQVEQAARVLGLVR